MHARFACGRSGASRNRKGCATTPIEPAASVAGFVLMLSLIGGFLNLMPVGLQWACVIGGIVAAYDRAFTKQREEPEDRKFMERYRQSRNDENR